MATQEVVMYAGYPRVVGVNWPPHLPESQGSSGGFPDHHGTDPISSEAVKPENQQPVAETDGGEIIFPAAESQIA